MKGDGALDLDYTGPQGGLLALAFAAGCVACFTFCALIGKFLWAVLGKAKDDQIEALKKTIDENEERCREMETRMAARISTLEGALVMSMPGHMRAQIQGIISEQRLTTDQMRAAE